MTVLIIVQILLLVLQVLSILVYNQTEDEFWLAISGLFFAGVIGVMVYILTSYEII